MIGPVVRLFAPGAEPSILQFFLDKCGAHDGPAKGPAEVAARRASWEPDSASVRYSGRSRLPD